MKKSKYEEASVVYYVSNEPSAMACSVPYAKWLIENKLNVRFKTVDQWLYYQNSKFENLVDTTNKFQWSFSYIFSFNWANSVAKIFVIKRAWACHI